MNKNAGSFLTARKLKVALLPLNYFILQHNGDGSLSFLKNLWSSLCSIDIIKVISNVTNC